MSLGPLNAQEIKRGSHHIYKMPLPSPECHSLRYNLVTSMQKFLFMDPYTFPWCRWPFKELRPADNAMHPELCVTRKIWCGGGWGGAWKKQGLDQVRFTLSPIGQTALQMVKISSLSAHTGPTGWTGFLKRDINKQVLRSIAYWGVMGTPPR